MTTVSPHIMTDDDALNVAPPIELPRAHCLRCGNDWVPRVSRPSRCPKCASVLWNTPRAQKLPGKPAPTRKGKRRGGSFTSETATQAVAIREAKRAQEEPQNHRSGAPPDNA